MEKLVFEDYTSLVDRMFEVAEKGDTAYAICFLDDAVEVMRELLKHDETSIGGINIAQENYNGYAKEYYVSVDGNMIVDVEPAWHEANEYHKEGYYWFDAEKIFIVGEANSAIIKNVDKSKCYEIEFKLFDDNDDDLIEKILENSKVELDAKGVPVGISVDIIALIDAIFGE